jgi:hypothetical protein
MGLATLWRAPLAKMSVPDTFLAKSLEPSA